MARTRHKPPATPVSRPARRRGLAPSPPSSQVTRGLPALFWALLLITFIAYTPALRGPFLFDDLDSIPDNPTIQRLWPPSIPLHPPAHEITISGRPVVNYSLALNYALNEQLGIDQRRDPDGPYKTVGYHVVNVLLHLFCGALIFGVIRRTLSRRPDDEPWASSPEAFALVITGLWLLHPIQTEAVDYLIQRTEVIVSICYVGTLYAAIRAWDATTDRSRVMWYCAALAASFLGMGSKEVMVTVPIAVALYDRAFRLASWKDLAEAGSGRRWFYLSLLLTSIPGFVLIAHGPRADTVGFHLGIPWYRYLYSQAWAILHYLRLTAWPDQLALDYGRKPVSGLAGVPGLIVLGTFGVATLVAWTRPAQWGWFGFLGAWFFMLLAPSSSIVPVTTEIAAERRIYLALVAVFVLLVIATTTLGRWIARQEVGRRRRSIAVVLGAVGLFYLAISGWKVDEVIPNPAIAWGVRVILAVAASTVAWLVLLSGQRRIALAGLLVLLAATTAARSRTYTDSERMWRDVLRKVPNNSRVYLGLGLAIVNKDQDREDEAVTFFQRAIALDSTSAPSYYQLALHALHEQHPEQAKQLFEHALALNPKLEPAHARLGSLLVVMGDPAAAIPHLEHAAANQPTAETLVALGGAYDQVGRPADAAIAFHNALKLDPARTAAMIYLGALLIEQGDAREALIYLEEAEHRSPTSGLAEALASYAYAETGRTDDAKAAAVAAVANADTDASVFLFAGRAMLRVGQNVQAEQYLTHAMVLTPSDAEVITTLGTAKAVLGKRDEAVALYRRALAIKPDYAAARDALAQLRR